METPAPMLVLMASSKSFIMTQEKNTYMPTLTLNELTQYMERVNPIINEPCPLNFPCLWSDTQTIFLCAPLFQNQIHGSSKFPRGSGYRQEARQPYNL